MPHEPVPPPGIRFFARIDRFHCECPSCTTLIVGDVDPRRSRQRDVLAARASPQLDNHQRREGRGDKTARAKARQHRAHPYNPFLQALRCPVCERVFLVGLLLYSVPPGSLVRWQPTDTKPTRRQLAALRQYTESRWATQFKSSGEEVNVAVDADCCCPMPDGFSAACPIHGDRAPREQADRYKGE